MINMKKAFTLIELLVVIGIIAILAGVLLGNYSGIIARVRSTKCETNLKNLANGVSSYATCGHYPYAHSAQFIRTTGGTDNQGVEIGEHRGWLSWLSGDTRFPIAGDSPASLAHVSFADQNDKNILFAITNGAIWTAVGKNRDCYVCPVHVEQCRKNGIMNPGWSYQMNGYFGFEATKGSADVTDGSVVESGSLSRADRILLFAEIPALTANSKDATKRGVKLPEPNFNGGADDLTSCGCLLTKDTGGVAGSKGQNAAASGTASIGFNHVRGRDIIGHVAFADGHVETLAAPKNGDFVNLTDWLCQGLDVAIRNGNYEKINDSDVE